MNTILVAGPITHMSTMDVDGGAFVLLAVIAAAGATMILMSALLMRKHAPRACPVRRHHYAGNHR